MTTTTVPCLVCCRKKPTKHSTSLGDQMQLIPLASIVKFSWKLAQTDNLNAWKKLWRDGPLLLTLCTWALHTIHLKRGVKWCKADNSVTDFNKSHSGHQLACLWFSIALQWMASPVGKGQPEVIDPCWEWKPWRSNWDVMDCSMATETGCSCERGRGELSAPLQLAWWLEYY